MLFWPEHMGRERLRMNSISKDELANPADEGKNEVMAEAEAGTRSEAKVEAKAEAETDAKSDARSDADAVPSAVSENIDTISQYREREEEHLSRLQVVVEQISVFFSRPAYFFGIIVFVLVWVAANLVADEIGWDPIDPPPFFWLQGLISLNAFLITTTLMIRQNRMAQLSKRHSHLDLQVNLLTDKKTSKIIALLEELRGDLPDVKGRHDAEAEELKQPSNTEAVLGAIDTKQKQESR
jgi:uncharacterized membrane protein